MTPDPSIDEIRRVRHEISRESGHDLRQLKETFAALESQFKRPPVDHGCRRSIRSTGVVESGNLAVNNRSSDGV